jgi:hypothetical protein
MIRKIVAIILAVLINGAVLAWFAGPGLAMAAHARAVQRIDKPIVLPAVTVRPMHAQTESLHRTDGTAKTVPHQKEAHDGSRS